MIRLHHMFSSHDSVASHELVLHHIFLSDESVLHRMFVSHELVLHNMIFFTWLGSFAFSSCCFQGDKGRSMRAESASVRQETPTALLCPKTPLLRRFSCPAVAADCCSAILGLQSFRKRQLWRERIHPRWWRNEQRAFGGRRGRGTLRWRHRWRHRRGEVRSSSNVASPKF